MTLAHKAHLRPPVVAGLILLASEVLTLVMAPREKAFLERHQITPPEVTSVGYPVAYFFAAVAVMAATLLVIPRKALKVILKALFVLLFAWGAFVTLSFFSVPGALYIALLVALTRLLVPRVWLHNLLMIVALSSIGTVYGVFFAPWTAILLMLIISLYDVLAVRFGLMLWMVSRLSDFAPVYVIPRTVAGWNSDLRRVAVFEDGPQRQFSLLGGGDVGFPLLLMVSVSFAHGLSGAVIVAAFALLGLAAVYWMQQRFLSGRPIPALPPITLMCLVGYVIAYFA